MDTLYIIGITLAAIGAVLIFIAKINLDSVRQWLIYATAQAEKELGSGTGQLKLRQVYDAFVGRFPWVARFVSFARFGELVDDALEDLRKMLLNNHAVREIIVGEEGKI